MKLYTHLNFGGNCEEAFRFYEQHLGGKITMIMKQSQMPADVKPPGGSEDAVIHARMSVAGVELIGNDVPPGHFKPIRSSYLYLETDSAEDADRIYTVLAEGGEIGIPMGEQFFAPRFAQLRDRFGTLWTIIYQPEPEGGR
ncbi:MAG TPA: VOC family protein [Thermoanaerobaculia bacterium]|jgi:PhnB protein|nr:VOC family protein [Thermoanaerobaculia bacterium]